MRLSAIDGGGQDGGRTPVVLVHGLFGRGRNLGRLIRLLQPDRRTIAVDLRSHGDSPRGPLEIDAMAADLHDTLDALGVDRVAIVGHSLGGKVSMTATLLRPERVARLLVADIAPVAYSHGSRRLARLMAALPIDRLASRAEADAALAADVPDASIRALLLQNLDARPPMRWRIGLDEINDTLPRAEGWPVFGPGTVYTGPTLFLRGDRSDYVEDEHRGTIRRFFPRARLATLREAGHWLHVDQPEAFGGIVRSFVAAADPVPVV